MKKITFLNSLIAGSLLILSPLIYHSYSNNNKNSNQTKSNFQFSKGENLLNPATAKNPLLDFSTTNSRAFLNKPAIDNVYYKDHRTGGTNFSTNDVSYTERRSNDMDYDEHIAYRFSLYDLTIEKVIKSAYATHYTDDHAGHGGATATMNVYKVIDPSHRYEISIDYWNDIDGSDDGTNQSGTFTLRDKLGGPLRMFGKNLYETFIDSASLSRVISGFPEIMDSNVVTKDFYLKTLTFQYYHWGKDASGWNNTYANASEWKGHTNLSITADNQKQILYQGIPEAILKQVLPSIFTILKNTSQQRDLKYDGRFWTDKTNPPKLHVGLNNDIFKAYDNKTWILDVSRKKIIEDQKLSTSQRSFLNSLINDYKVDKTNFDFVRNQLIAGEDIENINPSVFKYAFWYSQKAPKVNGMNLISWLRLSYFIDLKKTSKKTNLELLSNYLNNSEIELRWKLFAGTNLDNGIDQGEIVTKKIKAKELIDYPIVLKNKSTNNMEGKISDVSYKLFWLDNKINSNREITSITPYLTEDLREYFIDYDNESMVYKAFYQPNSLDISNGMWFYPLGENKKYNDDLETPDGQKAYKSFLYKFKENGKDENEAAFVQPSSSVKDIKKWVTSTPDHSTLEDKLHGQGLNLKNITYIVNTKLIAIINPYQTKNLNPVFWKDPAYELENVIDVFNGKTRILADYTDGRLSNDFNKSFSMTRSGKPSLEGLLENGRHKLSAKIKNFKNQNKSWNLIIDTINPAVKYDNTSLQKKELYYKAENGNYHRLYQSFKEVGASLVDKGIKSAKLSFVDSEGRWYEKNLDIKNISDGEEFKQRIKIIIDYQGLFKLEYVDLAGNGQKDYLWIQRDNSKGNNIISFANLPEATENHLLNSSYENNSQVIWINSKSSDNKVVINNLLAQNIVIKKFNSISGKMEIVNSPNDILYHQQKSPSVGSEISSTENPHSLAGDELAPLINGTGVKLATKGSRKFYEAHINIPWGGYYEIGAENGVFYKDESGSYISSASKFKILNFDNYNIPSKIMTEDHPNLKISEIGNGTLDVGNIYNPTNTDDLVTQGEGVWRKTSKGYNSKLIPAFTKRISVKFASMYSNWFTTPVLNLEDGLIFSKEGKYIVEYVDLAGNKHILKYLVFDYPRDFSKYSIRQEIKSEDKTLIKTLTFYQNPAIAINQDFSIYSFKGKFEYKYSNQFPEWTNELKLTPISYYYDFDIKVEGNDISEVKKAIGPLALQGWVNIINKKIIEEDEGKNGEKIKRTFFRVQGQGRANFNSSVVKPITVVYSVDGTARFLGTPIGVPPSITMSKITDGDYVSDEILLKTAYFYGKYIDLYEESGRREGLLVDHDADPNTPKVHLLENYNHYMQSLSEWIANGGTKDEFFKQRENPDKIPDLPPGTNDDKENSAQTNSPLKIGMILGIIGGFLLIFGGGSYIYFKRKSGRFSRDLSAKKRGKNGDK